MQVLLLSCNTGEGHNACAAAIAEAFNAHGDGCEMRDALGFISDATSRLITKSDIFLYRRMPELFRMGYGIADRHAAMFRESSLCSRFFARGAEKLCEEIAGAGYDAVICTHPFAALMLREALRHRALPVYSAFVATDYTCCPGVGDADLDLFFIPDEDLVGEFQSRGVAPNRIVPSGIPIRRMFYETYPEAKPTAKKHHLVMMCGSLGAGPIKTLTSLLIRNNYGEFDLTVICGTNKRLREQLERHFGHRGNLRILGYVEDMAAMLDSADVFITKPGGISVTEAAAKNVPMVFIHAVDGCEAYNRRFFVSLGGAESRRKPREAAELCRSLLRDPMERAEMSRCLSAIGKENAAELICETMHQVCTGTSMEGRVS